MTKKQQTAMQWLEKEMIDLVSFTTAEIRERFRNKFKQALAMERKQMIEAHYEGQCNNQEGYPKYISEQYFTDTYHTEP